MKLMNRNKAKSFGNLMISDYILSVTGTGNIMREINDVLVLTKLMDNL